MSDTLVFAVVVLIAGGVGLLAVQSSRFSDRVQIPAPALFLIVAALVVQVLPGLSVPAERTVERVVTVALVCILFDGGMHLGWSRFRRSAGPIASIGVLGTFLTAVAAALVAHLLFGLDWYLSVLLGTAISPTDPAVVFSVLGRREISGRSGAILEGESGANDPVGIALMASLITAGGLSGSGFAQVLGQFALQMAVGGVVGLLGGYGLLWVIRHLALPSEGIYPLRTLAAALLLYGVATLAHGSGFLAVFVAGILLGDERAPYKREIERFHAALASLAEIVAFIVLGLTVDLDQIIRADVWIPGLILGAVLTLLIRPVLVGLCLWPAKLRRNERAFVLYAGLKGAVPILLASYLLAAGVAQAERLYEIVVVVVVFSVVLQAGLVPTVAKKLHLPMRTVQPQPFALGVRLTDEPEGVDVFTVRAGSPADGRTIRQLEDLPGTAWVSFVVRDQQLIKVRPDTTLNAGDDVLVIAEPSQHHLLAAVFTEPSDDPTPPT